MVPNVAQRPITERMVLSLGRPGPWLESWSGGGTAALQRHAGGPRARRARLRTPADDDSPGAAQPPTRPAHVDRLGDVALHRVPARLGGRDAGARQAR